MNTAYRICKGAYPSTAHPLYKNKEEAEAEVARLEAIRLKNNEKADAFVKPANASRGWAFSAPRKDDETWSLCPVKVSLEYNYE